MIKIVEKRGELVEKRGLNLLQEGAAEVVFQNIHLLSLLAFLLRMTIHPL
jgi:hypothetical protein